MATRGGAPSVPKIGYATAPNARALVLELVDGDTLHDRIARGRIPFDGAVAIGREICEALQAAHEQGIVHRDLKPSNIKITADDSVKSWAPSSGSSRIGRRCRPRCRRRSARSCSNA